MLCLPETRYIAFFTKLLYLFRPLEQRQRIIIGFLGTRRFNLTQTCFISDSKAAALKQVAGLLETFHNNENRTWQFLYSSPSLRTVNPVACINKQFQAEWIEPTALLHKCLSTHAPHTYKRARMQCDYYYYYHHHHLLYAGYLYLYSWDKLCP